MKDAAFIIAILLSQLVIVSNSFGQITAPSQPATGPGSNNYVHSAYSKSEHGSGDLKYWIYEPTTPTPNSAPVVLYLHGWSADRPIIYEGLIEHFVKKGNTVIFPKYGGWLNVGDYENNARQAYMDALKELQKPNRVSPILDKTVMMGHSLGTQIAVRLADTADGFDYPHPKALILHEPAGADQLNDFDIDNNLDNIPSETSMVIILRDDWKDDDGGFPVPATIWNATPHLENRTVLWVKSDGYGNPDVNSEHNSVQTSRANFWDPQQGIDTVDWWGYWRPSEAALNFALSGVDGEYIWGQSSLVTSMGVWSDGTAVTPKEVVPDEEMERIYLLP